MQEPERAGHLDTDDVEVRTLQNDDLDWVVRIDKEHSGQSRRNYYEVKFKELETGVRISLAALVDGAPAGFLMGRLYYGEFGLPEPAAVLDSIGVSNAFKGQQVGKALMRQLRMNLAGLGIESVRTEVDWDQVELIRFFQASGFRPAPRLCIEMVVEPPRD